MNPTGTTETDRGPDHRTLRWQIDPEPQLAAIFLRAATDHSLRRTLTELYQQSTPIALTELAARISGLPTDETDDQVSTARILLAHSHLPRLADASLINYTAPTDSIELTPNGRTVLEDAIREI
ncbi:MAG: hypothetical protein R6V31_02190 [Halohasta sp.]